MRKISILAHFPVEIQTDTQGEYVRILVQGVSVCEGEEITPQGLMELFAEMGFDVKLVKGVFGGQEDDQYDDGGRPVFVPVDVPLVKPAKRHQGHDGLLIELD
jgi:hypothetical protein